MRKPFVDNSRKSQKMNTHQILKVEWIKHGVQEHHLNTMTTNTLLFGGGLSYLKHKRSQQKYPHTTWLIHKCQQVGFTRVSNFVKGESNEHEKPLPLMYNIWRRARDHKSPTPYNGHLSTSKHASIGDQIPRVLEITKQ